MVKGEFDAGDSGEHPHTWEVVSWRDLSGKDRVRINDDDLVHRADFVTVKVSHGENDKYVRYYGPLHHGQLAADIEFAFDGDDESYKLY